MFEKDGITTVGGWLVILILMCIPIVNIILLAIWAFGSEKMDQSRKNWAMANLVVVVIATALFVVLFFSGFAFMSSQS